MSLSLADLPTELLDQAVPLIDFEDQVRLSSTYCGAYWCRWSLRMPNYRSTTSRTAASRRIPKDLREIIKSLGASSPDGVMERRSSAVVDATIEATMTGSAPASLISLGEMPAMEWIELINSFGSRLAQFLHDGVTTGAVGGWPYGELCQRQPTQKQSAILHCPSPSLMRRPPAHVSG